MLRCIFIKNLYNNITYNKVYWRLKMDQLFVENLLDNIKKIHESNIEKNIESEDMSLQDEFNNVLEQEVSKRTI